jgi:diaminopropionate ammonia-lyase
MPAYESTLLVDAPQIAASLGVGRVLIKAENRRLGLPSFKILGASWATYRAIVERLGYEAEPWSNVNELARRHLAKLRPFTLAAATDGNHGRAVAFMARLLGFDARIFVPAGTVPARIDAIARENAEVVVVDGDYDAAVARAALESSDRCLVISDTSWPGYEVTPRRVIEGYQTIFHEIDDALAATGLAQPQVLVVPVGVGALMAAAVGHYRARSDDLAIVGVEPTGADCVLQSARAGHLETVPGPHRSIMVGLNCGTPSPVAWPVVSRGVDWFVSIEDEWATQAMQMLASAGVAAGETGSAGLGGFTAFVTGPGSAARRDEARIDRDSTVLILCTEGATDPEAYRRIVGRDADTVGRVMTAARMA